jgi:Fe2+ transport system protein FeoA
MTALDSERPGVRVAVPSQSPSFNAKRSEPVRLSALAAGQTARLHCDDLTPQDSALLRALGLTDRSVVRVCKIGEPCIVQVRATRIGLARSVADSILVVRQGGA